MGNGLFKAAVVVVAMSLLTYQDFAQTPTYTVTDLGTLGGTTSAAFDINNSGEIVGHSLLTGDVDTHPFRYSNGVIQDLGTLGGTYGYAYGINDLSQVVGAAA